MYKAKILKVLSIEDPIARDLALLDLLNEGLLDAPFEQLASLPERIVGPYERTEAYICLSRLCWSTSEPEAIDYLHSAAGTAMQAKEKWQPPELLSKVAFEFAEHGRSDEAFSVLGNAVSIARRCEAEEGSQDRHDCASVLRDIALSMHKAGMQEEANQVANSIMDETLREWTLEAIS